jgi:hypothetical protein
MVPSARVSFLTSQPSILPDGREGRADYDRLRRATVLPILPCGPLFFLLNFYTAPQHVGFRSGTGTGQAGISDLIGPRLCRILYMDFREFATSRHFGE